MGIFLFFLFGEFNRTTGLIDIPIADVLPEGVVRTTLSGSFALTPSLYSRDIDFSIAVGLPYDMETSLTLYTFDAIVLGFVKRIFLEEETKPGLALGLHNIGWVKYVSPVGAGIDKGWEDILDHGERGGLLTKRRYRGILRNPEYFSWFIVTSFRFPHHELKDYLRFHFGLGRGKYVGYGPKSRLINTDFLFAPLHEYAVGIFAGIQYFPRGDTVVSIILEGDGRDINLGFSVKYKWADLNAALTHVEQPIWYKPHHPIRFDFGIGAVIPVFAPAPKEPEIAREEKALIHGICTDSITKKPVDATIHIFSKGKLIRKIHTRGGEFITELPVDLSPISILCLAPGYLTERVTFSLVAEKKHFVLFKLSPSS